MLNTAIIGAGPYGLSVAAHLRRSGVPFRIFGRPMDSWLAHMPKGMMLKSDGFASNIYDPENAFTLERFCAERGIEYADAGVPVRLETFSAYGLAFRNRMVPELEDKLVTSVNRLRDGFLLQLEDGESVHARSVVLAVGITHFDYVPENLAHLPSEFLSHSARHHEVEPFRGRNVVVIGGGSSALDLAGLLREADAEVELVARQNSLKFHSGPLSKPRSWWQRIRHPKSGLGPGLRSRFFANAPGAFHYLPERLRIEAVRKSLGPSGGWFIKDKVIGKVQLHLGWTPHRVEVRNRRVHLGIRAADGSEREIETEHIIAATGYRVDLERLQFLNPEIRSRLKSLNGSPVLSSNFESSVPGLYFVGVAAANSFGPVMRFAFGAGFAARTLTRTLTKSFSRQPSSVAVPSVATSTK
ncbi:MAG TPA: NAD(P)-binding domain-containing protein [Terriglobales bacterium]|jgi:thioredoxin reductase|nr:NAD(P)-binding domain-containing protein [Terriglobales bacterium]